MKAEKKKLFSEVAFIFALAVFAIIGALFLYNIFKWKEYPDFGYGFRTATGIDIVGVITELGRKSGMQVGDRILAINGKTFTNIRELRAAMNREPGEKNTYLMERQGRQFEITISHLPKGFRAVFFESGFTSLLGLCYAFIGILVFLMKPHQRNSWTFFIFCATSGLFIIFLRKSGIIQPFWLENFTIYAYTFIPAVFIHLALSFPEERGLLRKHPKIQFLPYAASALLFIGIRSSAPTMMGAPKTLLIIDVAYITVSVLLFLGSCFQLWLRSFSEIVKLRAKMILLGFAIAISEPLLEFLMNTLFHVYIVPSFNYYLPFFIVFPAFVGYSIVKHDLFDIDAIIKRTYGYVLTTGTIAGIYGLLVLISNVAFGRFEITKSPLFPLVFVLAVVFLFNPVRNRMQRFIDRVFYRLEYDYRETVQKISESMRTLLGLDEIGKSIMGTALGVMFIDSGRVMLLDKEKKEYECLIKAGEREKRNVGPDTKDTLLEEKEEQKDRRRHVEMVESDGGPSVLGGQVQEAIELSEAKLPADDPLIQKIAERKKEVTLYDIQEDPFFKDERESCERALKQMEATLVVPLIYEDDLMGLISLGEKKSGKFYRKEDINLLNILANQGAVAIENAQMVEEVIEKERMEEELSIARDLQTSMLPATCPEIEGFEIAALSTQAREVGGDFFDFIEMSEERVGLVIGDVTGKSVSGALVMSASRSVFRMLSEAELTVGEIMIRANQRTKKDIKSGMFVALLYAVIDAKNRTLSLSNAGQTQPVYLSAETSKANLVETIGDTFPLGILEDSKYQETQLQLAAGDKMVFYTDGIVEAMNKQEEIFGFERLLEVVQGARSLSADSLLKKIIESVNQFAGDAEQHDDLTVIVVSVGE